MKITPEMNDGSLPYPGGWKLPACLGRYNKVLARGPLMADGSYLCFAYLPKQSKKDPVGIFNFYPYPEPHTLIEYDAEESETVFKPDVFLAGEACVPRLLEMYEDGWAAW